MNPTDVPIPENLKRFPLWKGKYVIHFTVYTAKDGSPDFKVVNEARRREALAKNLCHLCGKRLEQPIVFIGGPKAEKNRVFMDGPMHEECARYATKVCPYLALADSDHSKAPARVDADHRIIVSQAVDSGRPARMALYFTDRYEEIRTPEGILVKAGYWSKIDWTAMPERIAPAFRAEYQQTAWPPPEHVEAVKFLNDLADGLAVQPDMIGEPSGANYAAAVQQCPFHGKKS